MADHQGFVLKVGQVRTFGEGREFGWVRSFRDAGGMIHLPGGFSATGDAASITPDENPRFDDFLRLNQPPAASSILSRPGFFLSLGQFLDYSAPGLYETVAWRSSDDLRTIETIPVIAR